MPSVSQKIKVLLEWAPLIGLASEISAASTPLDRALKISAALKWAAEKTDTQADDEIVDLLEAVLKSDEGKALFDYLVALVTAVAKAEVP